MPDRHVCEYVDGHCRLPRPHGGVPDPDPATARVEDFTVSADRDGDMSLRCAHYARGCWWETDPSDGNSLGDLLGIAHVHLAESHRRTIDGTVNGA